MTREQTKKKLPEITHWANGGELWWYDRVKWLKFNGDIHTFTGQIYVIEDKHFEARKAFALGEPIEIKCGITAPFKSCTNPSWNFPCEYRPKPKHWYDLVSKDNPILCWVKGDRGKTIPAAIYKYEEGLFYDTDSYRWKNAEPIKPEECWGEQK